MESSRPSIQKLITALIRFQTEVTDPKKDKVNPMFKSKYVSLDSIIHTIRPILVKHGLAFSQEVSLELVEPASGQNEHMVVVTTTLFHESGETLGAVTRLKADKLSPQGAGSAFTYAKRYGLSALLGISADEDDDGNQAEAEAKKRQIQAPTHGLAETLRVKLYETSKEKGWTTEELQKFMKEAFHVEKSSDLTTEQYYLFMNTLKSKNYNDAIGDL